VAERLGLRHHSVVELSKRCEEAELIRRTHAKDDHRCVILGLTAKGYRVLQALSDDHERELSELLPTLIRTLTSIRNSHRQRSEAGAGPENTLKDTQ
jgi:DNA-binding MarR family transcriptional regulator